MDISNINSLAVSVIVPTYKPADYIWRCLDSLCRQSLSHDLYEVIVVVNGCSDPYLSQVRDYARHHASDTTIRVVHTIEPGVSNARNLGIETSVGRFLSFVDDDDWVSDNYLERLLALCDADGVMAVSNVRTYNEDTAVYGSDYLSAAFSRNIGKPSHSIYDCRSFFSTSCCKLISRVTVGEKRFPLDMKRGEDAMFMASVSHRVSHIRLATEDTVYYRSLRQGSASRSSLPLSVVARERLSMMFRFVRLYCSNVREYDFLFFCTRVAAVVVSIFKD